MCLTRIALPTFDHLLRKNYHNCYLTSCIASLPFVLLGPTIIFLSFVLTINFDMFSSPRGNAYMQWIIFWAHKLCSSSRSFVLMTRYFPLRNYVEPVIYQSQRHNDRKVLINGSSDSFFNSFETNRYCTLSTASIPFYILVSLLYSLYLSIPLHFFSLFISYHYSCHCLLWLSMIIIFKSNLIIGVNH